MTQEQRDKVVAALAVLGKLEMDPMRPRDLYTWVAMVKPEGREYLAGTAGRMKPDVAGAVVALATVMEELVEDIPAEEYEHMFELRHKADMRAIERWRSEPWPAESSRPPKELMLPDHTDLCVWLMSQLWPEEGK